MVQGGGGMILIDTATECYALDSTSDFLIVSIEIVDGKQKVEWERKVNRWTGAEIQGRVEGGEGDALVAGRGGFW